MSVEMTPVSDPDSSEYVANPRVAVLPFVNSSDDPDQDYFCDGVAVEILLSLTRAPGLNVIARSSVFALRGEQLSPVEAGRRLSASAVLAGEVQRSDGRVRMDVKLIRVSTGRRLWSGVFDRDVLDVFMIQDEVAAAVVEALGVPGPRRTIRGGQTGNVNAYDYYVRGRELYYEYSRTSVESASQCFEDAIGLDGTYALAYCGLADCYSYLYMYVDSSEEYMDRAMRASTMALEFNSELAEAWASRGLAVSLTKQYEEAESAFKKAIELDPQLFEARFLYARVCFAQGKKDAAARLFEEANRIRPEDYQSLLLGAQSIDELGQKMRAAELRIRGIAAAEQRLGLDPTATRALYLGANGLVELGEVERGLSWIERALTIEPDEPMLLYNAGCIFALAGNKTRCLDCLEKAEAAGLRQRGWYENDGNLDSVRDEPRFSALLEKLI
jgi:TolB-like protein/Flp pilus assembly protein TadD